MEPEIKLRVWDIEQKKLIYITSFYWFFHNDVRRPEDAPRYWFTRFIGIIDDFGKDIYFEDIISFGFVDEYDPSNSFHGTARVCSTMNGGSGIQFEMVDGAAVACDEGGEIRDLWIDPDMWHLRVIGDTYRNKVLTKDIEIKK